MLISESFVRFLLAALVCNPSKQQTGNQHTYIELFVSGSIILTNMKYGHKEVKITILSTYTKIMYRLKSRTRTRQICRYGCGVSTCCFRPTIKLSQLIRTIKLSQLIRTIKLSQLIRTIKLSQLIRTIKLSQLIRTIKLSQLIRTIKLSQLIRTIKLSQLIRTIKLSQLIRTIKLSQLIRTIKLSQLIRTIKLSQLKTPINAQCEYFTPISVLHIFHIS